MSIQAVAWVLENSESKLGDRCVLFSLANHTDKYGNDAWPSVKTIAEEANMNERNVRRCLDNLVEIGEISCVGERENDRGRPSKIWMLPKMPKPDKLSSYAPIEAESEPTEIDNRTICPVLEKEANCGQIVRFITGQKVHDNRTNPTPKPDKSDIALKELNRPLTVQEPSSSSEEKEAGEKTSRLCFDILRELPACRNATNAKPASVAELMAEHPDLASADWIDFARWVRDKYSSMARWSGENTTWSESPAKLLRDNVRNWKIKYRPAPTPKQEDAPSIVITPVADAREVVFCDVAVADCEAFSRMKGDWLPANKEIALKRGLEVRDIPQDSEVAAS